MDELVQIAGRAEFHAALRSALAQAAAEGWRELQFCDPDFAQWPLGERDVVESLTRWAGPSRKLTVFALHYDEVLRRHPRWVQWRRQWAHVVSCRALTELQAADVPVMLHAPGRVTVQLLDPLRYRGTVSRLAADGLQAGEIFDAILQRSADAFSATTLGL